MSYDRDLSRVTRLQRTPGKCPRCGRGPMVVDTNGGELVCSSCGFVVKEKIVETGPDRKIDGVVRWRRIDLKRVIAERFGVDYHQRYVGKLLKKLGFSHMSARPRHPGQDARIVEAFKKTSRAR